ncbi:MULTISPECIES: FRG domain-containing protein [Neisseria]|uniref:FRG domain-containing protein n=1 Tax=Neisseria TaxID=482 RepID=UPI0008A4331C|nr:MULTISPECIES: FRG domain-containing protein [Neisseria]OFV34578.1 hypothetical protein HMPREF3139_02490 [Neisseria sp. HMSC15G01]
MSDVWSRATTNNGVLEVTLNNWFEFLEFSTFFSDNMSRVYFRGQRDSSWGLTTTLDRFSATLDPRIGGTYDKIFNDFMKAIRGKVVISQDDEDEIWALGQHNGLATPFLDWTSAIFIALFFAFEEKKPSSTGYRTVWGIHHFLAERMKNFNKGKDKYSEFKFVDLMTNSNSRLLSQSGIFTKQPLNFNVREWVENELKGEEKRPSMFKINIPDCEREKILKGLFMMNISHLTIYPDLIGASKYCLSQLEMLNHVSSQKNDEQLKDHVLYK